MTLLGHLALWLAALLSAWAAAAGLLGVTRNRDDLASSACRAAHTAAAALVTGVVALAVAVLRDDFGVAYVAAHSSRTLPALYRWAVLHAGPEGALLCCATALAVANALALNGTSRLVADRARAGALVAALVATLAGAVLFALNPFARLPFTPIEGLGLDPRLQTPAGMLSPVMLYLAFAALTIPFARMLVALATGRVGSPEVVAIRRWVLACWLLLSVGLLLGMRAAYLAPPARGAWAWDPVLSTALGVWALLTAVLHAAPLHERRGRWRWWDVLLLDGCWLLAVAGTYRVIAGSGATPRAAFVGLLVVCGVGSLGLCLWRWPLLLPADDRALLSRPGRRSFGAHVAHAGAVLLGVALAAAATYQTDTQVVLRPGESVTLDSPLGGGYAVTYFGTSRYDRQNQFVTAATVELARAGRRLAVLRAERLQYEDVLRRPIFRPTARAGVLSRPREDVRVVLRGLSRRTEEAAFRLTVNPLAWWVWAGAYVLILGGLLATGRFFIELSRGAGEERPE